MTDERCSIDLHGAFVPLSTPLSYISDAEVVCVVGSSVCFWNLNTGNRRFLGTFSHGISRACGNPIAGLVAYCEGGTNPKVHVHDAKTGREIHTLSDVTELELADLAFSGCGSRLYALSRATSKVLRVYSMKTGAALPGCEMTLPQRFDKIAIYPGHKDTLALIRSSSVRIVSIQKSYQTYIARLLPSGLPLETDMAVSAYAWTPSRQLLMATRQGSLLTFDGFTGHVLHAVQAERPITSIAVTDNFIATAHLGNTIRFWKFRSEGLPTPEEGSAMLQQMPPMEGGFEEDKSQLFSLDRVADLEAISADLPLQEGLSGQVAYLQALPESDQMLLTTADGEIWAFLVPEPRQNRSNFEDVGSLVEASGDLEVKDLQLTLLSWFHTHPISDGLILDRTARIVASSDEGGRVRIWQLSRECDPKGFRTISLAAGVSTLCADPEDAGGLLFAGTDVGTLHLISCAKWKVSSIIDSIRLAEVGIARLKCVGKDRSHFHVAALLFDGRIAFLSVSQRDPKLVMLGFVDLKGEVEDLAFGEEGFEGQPPKLFAVGSCREYGSPLLWVVSPPPADFEPSTEELDRVVCGVACGKLGSSQKIEDKPTALAPASQDTVLIGFTSGDIKLMPKPNFQGLATPKTPHLQPISTLPGHDQLITRLQLVGPGRQLLISSSMDGSVRKMYIDEALRTSSPTMLKYLHNPYNGGVSQVFATCTGDYLMSTGSADGLLVWSDPRSGNKMPQPLAAELEKMAQGDEALLHIDDQMLGDLKPWKPISEEEKAQRAEATDDPELTALALAQRRALMLEVENLRKKLRLLIEQNATCPELEQLPRSEFCVDFEQSDGIAAKTKERCDALRAQIERENVARQLVRDRLIKEFWDPMPGKGCQITSFSSSMAVSNYPERLVPDEEKIRLKKLRIMRQAEKMEVEFLKGSTCPSRLRTDAIIKTNEFATGKESYIVNWWQDGSDAAKKATDDQRLLYQPFELQTSSRRRLQIHLLQALATSYRADFNKLFEGCQHEKKGVMDQIKEKVLRIRSILGELQIEEEVQLPDLDDSEDPNAVLEVKDREIKVEKWISPEEKAKLEEARLKEEERQRQLRENDAGQRALQQMMGGTLKTKKDLSALEIVLDKEPWMDEIPEEEMTEAQLQAMKEYHEKERALAEEQDKYRKQLDVECQRLKQEVQDLMKQFEGTLKDLNRQRFAFDSMFFYQELYCVRLQLALLQSVEDATVLTTSSQELQVARNKLEEAEAALQNFTTKVATKKAKQEERLKAEKDASTAANFRLQFANSGLETEMVTALLQLFRKRSPAVAQKRESGQAPADLSLSAQNSVQVSQGGNDPYPDIGVNVAVEGLDQEDLNMERPENIDPTGFERMLELRAERAKAEFEVQVGAAELREMNHLLAYYQGERDEAERATKQLELELEDHKQLMQREMFDIEVLFKLKQGRVEVPQAAVVTDYSDAVVLDCEVLESRNRRILEIGRDKVGILQVIKEFRKKLSLIQWEYKMLLMQTHDLEERTKDVHMLRVTKGLQSLLKGSEEGRNKADADSLERKLEHLSRTMADKEAALKKQHAMNSHAAKMRKAENATLEKKLRELQNNVIQREHIRRLRAPQPGSGNGGGGLQDGEKPRIIGGGGRIEENEEAIRGAHERFREVKTRQTLMEEAKKNTEEIDILSKELDRLRQKTFPSFVQLSDNAGYPDRR